ncbi:MAG: DUF4127 family protein [Clostridia bacterium]|nr:DUF4127 family protein [Clostridia bacterium]
MRICCLPLDGRPCNALFPVQYAAFCGAECVVPRPEEMDSFTSPALFEKTRAFLERELPACEALALSVDHLCYGSLLASRETTVTREEARRRLQWLEQLHTRYPDKPIHAFNVIVRVTTSALSREDVDVYNAMIDYSYHAGRAAELGEGEGSEDLRLAETARARIPAAVLQSYRAMRERNHEVNALCIALTQKNVLSSLTLTMEDSAPYGFHRAEQKALQALVRPGDPIVMRNGADEATAVAVMRAAARGRKTPLAVTWLGMGGDFIAKYEDRPFSRNLEAVFHELGIVIDETARQRLVIVTPPDGAQQEAAALRPSDAVDAMADAVDELTERGNKVYLLDLLAANGGSMQLMTALRHPEKLCGYSAWNTATNAMGTLAAQIVSDRLAGKANALHRNERILDDLFYQADFRQRVGDILEREGQDALHLANPVRAEALLRAMYDRSSAPLIKMCGSCSVSLPWPRIFEAKILCHGKSAGPAIY